MQNQLQRFERIYIGQAISIHEIRDIFWNNFKEKSSILFGEMYQFGKRNSIMGQVCMRCFKAHLLESAKRLEFSEESLNILSKRIKCEIGHNNYYLDNEELKSVS